ncbi:hypothetical protein LTR17_010499 [Elasticomyces elasticus]|nr:hypothetical protein LTR17_010499 [Elasticomyces elasticus]
MLSRNVVSLTTALAILDLTRAACVMHNKLDDVKAQKAEGVPDTLCTPGGDGEYQFAMVVSQVSVPTFDSGSALAGLAGSEGFVIFDSQCVPLAAYGPEGEGNDCGVPYEMNYIEGKPLVTRAFPSILMDNIAHRGVRSVEDVIPTIRMAGCGLCSSANAASTSVPAHSTTSKTSRWSTRRRKTRSAFLHHWAAGTTGSLDTRFSTIGLYDSECHSVGTYRVGPEELAAGCALPLEINYFGDDRIITIRHLATDVYADGWNVDEPAFVFEFEGRSYGSTDDWCADCKGQGSDDELNQGCMCGFYGGN